MRQEIKDWIGWGVVVLLWGTALAAVIWLSGCSNRAIKLPHEELHDLQEPKSCLTHFINLYNPVIIEQGSDFIVIPGMDTGVSSALEYSGTELEMGELEFFTMICYLTNEEVRVRLKDCLDAKGSCRISKLDIEGE